jgi:septal ring factor EnvC (AmiA/AmiB activator)
MRRKHLVFPLLLLFFFLTLPIQAQKTTEQAKKQEEELTKVRKELELKRKKIAELKGKEGAVFAELQNIEEELELIEQLTARLDKKLFKVELELKKENENLGETQLDLKQRRELLAFRIRGIYKYARFYQYQMIFSSSSLSDLFRRLKYLQLIAQADNDLISGFLKEKNKLEKSKKILEAKRKELYALKGEKRAEEKKRTEEKTKRQKVLSRIRSEKNLYLQAAKELEISAGKIEDFLARYEKERQKEESGKDLFKMLKGRLNWPVKGKVISNFGQQVHPIFKTVTFNQGIDIQSAPDASVQAVADGKAIFSSWLRGRGKFVILQHEYGYYSIYADLGEVYVVEGEEIKEGQIIGSVGEGSLFSNSSLHFELRKGKTQLDPLEWLK